ncbi:CBS domain-containing protein [Proteobacteria bacterium 005FR1]|nr:CBS domain-containing protein [Proteobacteria bacterium 005FR1]
MQVREIMTPNPACCTPNTRLQDAAKLMAERDCGELPIIDDDGKLVGVVTDRDICCRGVARGPHPEQADVRECMTSQVDTVRPEDDVDACCQLMDEHQIRRVPVVDEEGKCCGIVSQADIAREFGNSKTGNIVRDISRPSREASSPAH